MGDIIVALATVVFFIGVIIIDRVLYKKNRKKN